MNDVKYFDLMKFDIKNKEWLNIFHYAVHPILCLFKDGFQ
jgi:hypothetical protein